MYPGFRLAIILLLALLVRCGPPPEGQQALPPVLRVAIDREPSTFNRLLATDLATHIVTDQLYAPLIRLDAETQELEPMLAESWEHVGDSLVFHLRKNVRFSDGAPFTARDVLFTFEVLTHPDTTSQLAETIRVDGEPIRFEALDDYTVAFRLPRRVAGFERVFDSIRILPAHRLETSLREGTIEADTGTAVAPEDIVGLGPFRLRSYQPGQRVVLERNPNYFGQADGLPKLDAIVFEVMADKSASLLRLAAGEIDIVDHVDPESFEALERNGPDGVILLDAGPGLSIERMWFNLNPESPIPERKRAWFRDVRFRRAVSLAIDREALARVVYGGYASPASGPVSPANVFWRNASTGPFVHDVQRARTLLEESGFRRQEGGALFDETGERVSFTLLTRADDVHTRLGGFLQNALETVGIEMHVAQPGASLPERLLQSFDYEAVLLSIGPSDPDPSSEMPFWMSSSFLHFWHPSQAEPATDWEARVDALMDAQAGALDRDAREAAFNEVQLIAREQLPMIELVAPHVLLAASPKVRHLRPTPFSHFLWNSEAIAIGASGDVGKSTRR